MHVLGILAQDEAKNDCTQKRRSGICLPLFIVDEIPFIFKVTILYVYSMFYSRRFLG